MKENQYKPDIAIPPGETIAETVNVLMSQRLGLAICEYEDLLRGDYPIDNALAEKLAAHFGPPKYFWLNLEANYRQLLAEGKPRIGERTCNEK